MSEELIGCGWSQMEKEGLVKLKQCHRQEVLGQLRYFCELARGHSIRQGKEWEPDSVVSSLYEGRADAFGDVIKLIEEMGGGKSGSAKTI